MSRVGGFHLLLFAVLLSVCATDETIDLRGPGCDKIGGYTITDENEVMTVENVPNYNALPSRDHCDVTIRAAQARRIQYLISLIKFNECGIEVLIFDSLSLTTVPKHRIKCGSETEVPIKGMTDYNVLRIRVRQTTPQSRHYEFLMRLKNDLGPTLEYLEDEYGYQGESMHISVVVGLVIAGVVVIIALVLLAIYLCVRARQANLKEEAASAHGDSSVFTSGTSQAIFPSRAQPLSKRNGYGSFEDVRSTTSSQEQANGSYANPAYTKGSDEKKSERQASFGRARGKTSFANEAFDNDDGFRRDDFWEEGEATRGSLRKSRFEAFSMGDTPKKKALKSAMKKPTEIEMSKVNTQPVSILKQKTRSRSPNRSYAGSSTDGSTVDANAMIRGYKDSGMDNPNVTKSLGMQRRPRSRSGGRSHHSTSSRGSQRGRRSQSADKKPPKDTGRMYTGAFIDDSSHRRSRARSNSSAGRSRARSDRTSDSIDSASTSTTTTTSRRVSMNPGGRRVHIKGEETDI
ncbi:hypothetical protein ElyMa_002228100 [Elysia marginata]|uniref:CUB domain-containing protein n=1 Tax=Elysia marginata TaxID=1093978 RepID=A0AAV4FUB9_9GAST|nr:hypothetical protein ElyMa_002228100 [Elysia marginata]